MSKSTARARIPSKAPRARAAEATTRSTGPDGFATRWNDLDADRRRQVRRLVRLGRPQETPEDALLAVGFAAYQRTRPWYRLFWLWLPLLALAGLVAGLNTHPIVIGMVLAAAGNAVLVRRGFRRAQAVNAALLATDGAPAAA